MVSATKAAALHMLPPAMRSRPQHCARAHRHERPDRQRSWAWTAGIAAAGACAVGLPAHAQSSVTVFGVADLAFRSVNVTGVGYQRSLTSGGNSTARIGFRGSEDLGGGLGAGFHLEAGLRQDTGTIGNEGLFFDRRSTLSLSSPWGELRLGRDQVPTHTLWLGLDPFAFVGVASAGNLQAGIAASPGPIRSAFGSTASTLNTLSRTGNSMQYILPAGLGGFEGRVMHAFQEGGLSSAGNHRVTAAQIGWRSDALSISAAHTRTGHSLIPEDFRDSALGAQYDFGWARLSVGQRRFSHARARQANTLLAAVVPVGAGQIKVSWMHADLSGPVAGADLSRNDATQLGLGYAHNLSRRTALYAQAARVSNRGRAVFVVPGGPAAAAGRTSRGYEFGIRHNF